MKRILPIVEGDGDERAVPELIRRVAGAMGHYDVKVQRAQPRGDLPKVLRDFDKSFLVALKEKCPILWVMDYDCKTCNDQAVHVQQLRQRGADMANGMAFEIVFMVQEYESLFLADHETARKVFPDIASDRVFPTDPESIRDAKGWLKSARSTGNTYKPTQHQQKLTSQLDLDRLRQRSPSYRRFEAAVQALISAQS